VGHHRVLHDPRRLQGHLPDAFEETHPVAEQDRHQVDLELVEQAGLQVLPRHVRAADHQQQSLSPAAARAWPSAASIPSVTNV
jgi:hypothetical protein